jgi:D-lactate dehydrogenase
MTPRQRIAVRREQASAKANGDLALARELARDSVYPIIETCAADGMCGTVCPLGIDTGLHVKDLRIPRRRSMTRAAWRVAATRWDIAIRGVGLALDAASNVPAMLPMGMTRVLRGLYGRETVPAWEPHFPRGGSARRPNRARKPAAIYLPSCTASMFAPAISTGGVSESVMRLASRAGVELIVPDMISRLCCGAPWSSKGLPEGEAVMRRFVAGAVAAVGADDDVLIVSDAASCSQGYRDLLAHGPAGSRVTDTVTFAVDTLLPRLTIHRRFRALALHPTCSSTQLGINAAVMTIAQAVAERAVVPDGWGCCGMAGDRGLLYPELPAAATEDEVRSVAAGDFDTWASVNRPCEIAMTRATGRPYRHILELLDEATAGSD